MNIRTDVEFKVGRRSIDGIIRLAPLSPQLIQLSVSYRGERASSVLLTRSQIQALREALTEYELALTGDEQPDTWNHEERRAVG